MNEEKDIRPLQFLPYIGSLLILFGIFRLIVYYQGFGINIINFLDFSEILTSFLDIIVFSIIFIVAALIQVQLYPVGQQLSEFNSRNIWDKILKTEDFLKRFVLYIKYAWPQMTALILVFFVQYIYGLFSLAQNDLKITALVIIGSIFYIFIKLEYSYKKQKFEQSKNRIFFNFAVLHFAIVIIMLLFYSIWEIKHVKRDLAYKNVKIEFTDGQKILSNDTIYYIGNTKNFAFIFNAKQNTTQVRAVSDIKSISFPLR